MSMRSRLHAALLALLCLAAFCCQAQPTRIADLSLKVELEPDLPLQPGTTATLTFRFTNSGPDDLPAVGAGSSGYEHLDFEVISLFPTPPSICQMYFDDLPGPPGQPSYLVATVFAGPVGAGETKVCTVALRIAPTASGSMPLEFYATDGQAFLDDPVRANNRVALALGFGGLNAAPITVPTDSPYFLFLLLAGFVWSAGTRARHEGLLP